MKTTQGNYGFSTSMLVHHIFFWKVCASIHIFGAHGWLFFFLGSDGWERTRLITIEKDFCWASRNWFYMIFYNQHWGLWNIQDFFSIHKNGKTWIYHHNWSFESTKSNLLHSYGSHGPYTSIFYLLKTVIFHSSWSVRGYPLVISHIATKDHHVW